jgi:hypothetical protein
LVDFVDVEHDSRIAPLRCDPIMLEARERVGLKGRKREHVVMLGLDPSIHRRRKRDRY